MKFEKQDEFIALLEARSEVTRVATSFGEIEKVCAYLNWPSDDRTCGLMTPKMYACRLCGFHSPYGIQWKVCVRLPGMRTAQAKCYIWRDDRGIINRAATIIVDDRNEFAFFH